MSLLNFCNKTIEFSFYLLFFTVPLIFTNSTSELFEFNKMWVTFGLTVTIASAWFTKMFLEKQFRIRRTPLDIPILLFLIAHIISTLISLDPRTSVWGYYSRFNGGLLSIMSYILLYYAYVTNANDFDLPEIISKHKPVKALSFFTYSSFVRICCIAGGLLIYPLGLFTAQKIVPDSANGHPVMFLFCILTSFIFFMYALPRKFVQRTIFISFFSGLVVVLWGIPAHFGYDPSCFLFRGTFDVSCWTDAFHPTVRIFSTLGQPAWLAAYTAFLLPLSIGYFVKSHRKSIEKRESITEMLKRISPFLILTILFYLAMLYANTRAGFAAFWIANNIFWSFIIFQEVQKQKVKTILLSALFFVDMLFLAATVGLSLNTLFWFVGIIGYLIMLAIWAKKSRIQLLVICGICLLCTSLNFGPFPDIDQHFNASYLLQKTFSSHKTTTPTQTETKAAAQPTGGTVLENGGSESGAIRQIVWKGAIKAWETSPLFGTGVETFAYAYYQVRPVSHNMTSEWDYLYNKAHNEFLNYLTTTGIFGFGSYMAIIILFLFLTTKYVVITFFKKKDPEEHDENPEQSLWTRTLTISLIAGYITILITNFFGFSVVIMNIYFFLIPAIFFLETNSLSEKKVLAFPKHVSNNHVTGGGYVGITAVWLLTMWFLILLVRFWFADVSYAYGHNLAGIGQYQQAYTYLQDAYVLRAPEPVFADDLAISSAALAYGWFSQKDVEKAKQFAGQAVQLSDDVVQSHPNNVIYWKDRVRIFFTLAQIDPQYSLRALQAIQRAEQLAPTDAKVHYNLGVIYGQTGNLDLGVKTLEETVALKPNYREAYYALAVLYRQKATDNTDKQVTHPEFQQKAEENLRYILTNLSPNDNPSKQLLKDWGTK